MEPILLYGVPQGCSFGSIVALEWLGAPYRLCRVGMLDDMQSDLFGRINHVRETPVLILEDGRALSESGAILQNIAARGVERGLGFPAGSANWDRLNQGLAYLNTSFFSAFAALWAAYEMAASDPDRHRMLRENGIAAVAKAHAQLDRMLEGRDWLVGEQRSVADAYFAGLVRWGAYHKAVDLADYPHVQALAERLEADPAVVFAHAIEAQAPARSAGGFKGHVTLAESGARLAA